MAPCEHLANDGPESEHYPDRGGYQEVEQADVLLERAREEGQRIVEEAQALGARLVEEANQRAATIETVIAGLRSRRREVRAELMRLVELIQGLVRDDQQLEREEPATGRLALLSRRKDTVNEG